MVHKPRGEFRKWDGKWQKGLTVKKGAKEQKQNGMKGHEQSDTTMTGWYEPVNAGATCRIRAQQSALQGFLFNQFPVEEKWAALKAWNKKAWRQRTIPGWQESCKGSFPCENNNLPTAECSVFLWSSWLWCCWKQVSMAHWSGSSTVIPTLPRAEVQVYAAHTSGDLLLPGSHGTGKTKGKICITAKELWFLRQIIITWKGLSFQLSFLCWLL